MNAGKQPLNNNPTTQGCVSRLSCKLKDKETVAALAKMSIVSDAPKALSEVLKSPSAAGKRPVSRPPATSCYLYKLIRHSEFSLNLSSLPFSFRLPFICSPFSSFTSISIPFCSFSLYLLFPFAVFSLVSSFLTNSSPSNHPYSINLPSASFPLSTLFSATSSYA